MFPLASKIGNCDKTKHRLGDSARALEGLFQHSGPYGGFENRFPGGVVRVLARLDGKGLSQAGSIIDRSWAPPLRARADQATDANLLRTN